MNEHDKKRLAEIRSGAEGAGPCAFLLRLLDEERTRAWDRYAQLHSDLIGQQLRAKDAEARIARILELLKR